MDLVIDIGNARIKGGVFEEKKLLYIFALPSFPLDINALDRYLDGKPISRALLSSVNGKAEEPIASYFKQKAIPFSFLDTAQIKLILAVEEPEALGHDRIAGAYGALARFPLHDCIVIDIGTAITADFIEKEGRYTGGMIYPGAHLCAKALADYTDKLPLIAPSKPLSPLAKTTKTHIESGIYYGQLGAIERMIDALRMTSSTPSSIKVIATGGATEDPLLSLQEDLSELVDLIDPHLTLIGMREIFFELFKKE